VPPDLDWDLWLGITEYRPYTAGGEGYSRNAGFYTPHHWRGHYDFGCGAIGDMACHILGAANMALKLGTPTSVECIRKEGTSNFMFPKKSVIRFDFPARGSMPPLKLFWYDGLESAPQIPGVPPGELLGDLPFVPRAQGAPEPPSKGFVGPVFDYDEYLAVKANPNARMPKPDGSLFIGDKGMLTTGTYGEDTRLLPVDRMREYKMPAPLLTRSPGHYRDWIRAAKGGEAACSNFNVASPFVEWMLLGVIALRVEGKVEYDPVRMRITSHPEANAWLKPSVRKGWSLT
jgi:hypothetical protein